MGKKIVVIFGLIGIGVAGRLLPHLPNATPVNAITIAARKHAGSLWAYIVPLAAMVISDAFIGFYDWRVMLSVYISFATIALLSSFAKKHPGFIATGLLVVSAPIIFFLLTNFAVWIFSPWYEKSFAGLLYCYELGLPFFRYMLLGDMAYSAAILGALALGRLRVKAPITTTQIA